MLVTFVNKAYLKVNMVDGFLVQWLGVVLDRCEHRGSVDTIGWLKALRLAYHRLLSGAPLKDTPGFGVSLEQDGLPLGQTVLNELFRSRDPAQIRLANTILGVSRILPGWESTDVALIIQPYPGLYDLHLLGGDLAGLVTALRWTIPLP